MSSRFVHLHAHSHYSLLSALPKIDELVAEAKKLGMPALALTDNGNLYGAIDFYKACKKKEIKPIIGVDFYVAARGRKDMQAGIDNRRSRLVLLAMNETGYKNLLKLVTYSNFEGFYYRPRIDRELIEKYNEGLICIMPSFSGEIALSLKGRTQEKAEEVAGFYKKAFGGKDAATNRLYLEITRHPEIDGHEQSMKALIDFGHKHGIPLMAAHDVYYIHPEDRAARETLLRVNSHTDGSERSSDSDEDDFSFISGERALELFRDLPEALDNARTIALACNLELKLGSWVFPSYIVANGKSYDDELRRFTDEGYARRGIAKTPELLKRSDYELEVIKNKGYAPYFLVVSDLLRHAHDAGILTTTRGSAAGSFVSYLTGITNVDPIAFNLPFERFLNPDRPSAPDIDMDIADNRRDEMITYARQKYGADHVAQIGTFGTMLARGSIRDVARAMGFTFEDGDKIAKLIPMGSQGFPMTLDHAMELVPELKSMYQNEQQAKTVIDMARKIEGCARHISVHAAGVVIAPGPLVEYTPLQFDPKGEGKIITQYDMYAIEEAGLLKLDFLGIRNLAILADAVDRVKKIEGITVDIENVKLDDTRTFEMLARGETIGLFQLNGSGMTRFLVDLKPTAITDINLMVALYRPGPMDNINEYIQRKNGVKPASYPHPAMKKFLEPTYGVLVYQDDLLMTAIEVAGYTWAEVDKFRKAVGKKIPEEMAKQHTKFVEGAQKHGKLSEKKAEAIWKLFEPFQGYGFNKCLTGDTEVIDGRNGTPVTVKELYDQKKRGAAVASVSTRYKLASRKVSAVMENGVKQTFELRTRTGRTIRATDNHPFLTISGWKELGTLTTGQRIAIPRTLELMNGSRHDPDKAAVLGYLLSEGNFCHPTGVYFYSTQENEVQDFISHARTFKNSRFTLDRSKSAVSVYCGQTDQRKGNPLVSWVKELGLSYRKATEKFIPRQTFTFDTESLSILLGKMWQGDGCVSIANTQAYYASSSNRLARDVQHLLLRLGIMSAIHSKKFKYRGSHKAGYTVVVSHRDNIKRFLNTAGKHLIGRKRADLMILAKKADHLSQHPARGTKDIIPAEVLPLIRQAMERRGISVKELSTKIGLSARLFSYDKRKIGFQREIIQLIGRELKSPEILALAESDVYWDEIVSIRKAGREMTYDLTVPPDHNFVANDIVVHNSHAASYGKVAYQTAYMKANFPEIYMSAVLSAESGDTDMIGEIVTECRRMMVPVLPPDVNESFSQFTVVKSQPEEVPLQRTALSPAGSVPRSHSPSLAPKVASGELPPPAPYKRIRFGLVTIKNFGQGISTAIIEERKKAGPFKSVADFLDRVKDRNLNKKSLEALIKSGAMDCFGEDRGTLLANLDLLLEYNKEKGAQFAGQDSLFGGMTDASSVPTLRLQPVPPADMKDKLTWEKELLGLYISGHPLEKYREVITKKDIDIKRALETKKDGDSVVLGVMVDVVRAIQTKNNETMAFITITDFSGSAEAVVFPRVYREFRELIQPDKCLAVKATVNTRNGEKSFVIERMKGL